MDKKKVIARYRIPHAQDLSGANVVASLFKGYVERQGITGLHPTLGHGYLDISLSEKAETALRGFEEQQESRRLHVKLKYPLETESEKQGNGVKNHESSQRNQELVRRLSAATQKINGLEKELANTKQVRIKGVKDESALEALGKTLYQNSLAYVDAGERLIAKQFYSIADEIPTYQLAQGFVKSVNEAERVLGQKLHYLRAHGLEAVSDLPKKVSEELWAEWEAAEQSIKTFKEFMSFKFPVRVATQNDEEEGTGIKYTVYTIVIPVYSAGEDRNSRRFIDTLKDVGTVIESKFGVACDYLGDQPLARLQIDGKVSPPEIIEYELGQAFGKIAENAEITAIRTPYFGGMPERK